MKIKKIDKEVLMMFLHASKTSHPNEFAGILRSSGDIISEILLLPGTFSSDRSAIMRLDMLPLSSDACGSVHSHPSPRADPSEADLSFFEGFGSVHIIIAYPYTENSWKAFNSGGVEVELEIVDSEENESSFDKYVKEFFE